MSDSSAVSPGTSHRRALGLRLAVLVVAAINAAAGVLSSVPTLVGIAALLGLVGTAMLASGLQPAHAGPKELRVGGLAAVQALGVVLHAVMLSLLWPVHVVLDLGAFGDEANAATTFWMTVLFASGLAVLGTATLPLHRRALRLASGTHGRVRVLLATHAAMVVIVAEVLIAAVIVVSQRERAAFELDSLFGESGPLLWRDTLHTIAAGQGTLPLLLLGEWALVPGLVVQLGVLLSSWFLVSQRFRVRFFWVFDSLVLAGFLFALWALPFSPPEEGSAVPAGIALAITAVASVRGLARLIPLMLDAIERAGFRPLVAARLLRARKSGFLTIIGVLSILAVSFSSCTLTTTLSVMGGFRDDLQQKILGNSAHVVIDREYGTWDGWGPVLDRVRAVEGVEGASPYVEGEVMITSASNLGGAVLRGIDPATIVTDLPNNLRNISVFQLLDRSNRLPILAREVSVARPRFKQFVVVATLAFLPIGSDDPYNSRVSILVQKRNIQRPLLEQFPVHIDERIIGKMLFTAINTEKAKIFSRLHPFGKFPIDSKTLPTKIKCYRNVEDEFFFRKSEVLDNQFSVFVFHLLQLFRRQC